MEAGTGRDADVDALQLSLDMFHPDLVALEMLLLGSYAQIRWTHTLFEYLSLLVLRGIFRCLDNSVDSYATTIIHE